MTPRADRERGGDSAAVIAFWAGSFERAGTQRYLVELVRRIDRRRFRPVVLSLVKRGELLDDLASLDVPVHEFGTGRTATSPQTIRGLRGAHRFLRRERVDILSCLLGITTLFGPLVGRAARVPVVVNNQRNLGYWIEGRLKPALYGYVNRRVVDAVLVNSEAARAELESRFSVPRSKVAVIANGIDLDAVDAAEPDPALKAELGIADEKIVGIVAKLTPVKGHEHFLRAASIVAHSRGDTRFVVVGDGPRRAELEAMAAALGIEGRVHFLGAQSNAVGLLKLMDVFVLSSLSEGSPNAVLEAMASGVPVVATSVGGVPDLVRDGETGHLVGRGDAEGLASRVLEVLADPDGAAKMGRTARTIAREHHDIGTQVARTEALYSRLLAASARGSTGRGRRSESVGFGDEARVAGRKRA